MATALERRRALPVDALVPEPIFASTHAITIDAPPEQVWPWVAQMGAGRAGWYSWDAIDNGGTRSANRVVPELQTLAPGAVMPAVPGATNAFVVASVEPPRDLVLTVPDGSGGHTVAWEHVLDPIPGGRTRLIVRGLASARWLDLARAQPPDGRRRIFIERAYAALARLPRPLLIAFATAGHRLMEARHLRGIQRRSTAAAETMATVDRWRRALLSGGILASVLYVAMTLFVGLLWEGYSVASNVPSELSAIGAPTRTLWILLGAVYGVLMIAFGWIVWASAPPNRALRVAGALVMAQTAFGQFWPPMHQRAVLAAGGGTLTDTLHLVWAAVTGIFFILIVGFGAAALGKRFRLYSLATMVIVLACGAVTGTYASNVQANLPTPWVGIWERISIATFMAWIVVLALALLRAPRGAAPSVRATSREKTRALPGDALIEQPVASLDHALTIRGSRRTAARSMTSRTLRHRATMNLLRMGHCAPSITQTLLEVTEQQTPWAVKLAAGLPGGIANTGYECGGVTAPLIVLGLRHGLRVRDGLPEVVCRGEVVCRQFTDRNGTLSCVAIRGGPDRFSMRCPRIVREAPEMFFARADRERDVIPTATKDAYRRLYAHFTREEFHCARDVLQRLHADPHVLDAASAFVGGTVFRGVTCSALTAGVMALGLRDGAIEDSPARVLKMAAIMLAGGNALADDLNEFNRLTNRGHELAAWFAHEFGSTLCRDITRCDFAKTEDVERYAENGCVGRCRSIAAAVARKVEERCHA